MWQLIHLLLSLSFWHSHCCITVLKMHNVENTNRQWWYFCFIFAETITYLVTTDCCKLVTFLMQNVNRNDACPVKNRHFSELHRSSRSFAFSGFPKFSYALVMCCQWNDIVVANFFLIFVCSVDRGVGIMFCGDLCVWHYPPSTWLAMDF